MNEIETNIKYFLLKVRTELELNVWVTTLPAFSTETLFEICFLSQVEIGTWQTFHNNRFCQNWCIWNMGSVFSDEWLFCWWDLSKLKWHMTMTEKNSDLTLSVYHVHTNGTFWRSLKKLLNKHSTVYSMYVSRLLYLWEWYFLCRSLIVTEDSCYTQCPG